MSDDGESAARVGRRGFLKGVALAGGAGVAGAARGQTVEPGAATESGFQTPRAELPSARAAAPSAAQLSAEHDAPAELERLTTTKTGSDFMVDVCKTLDLRYLAAVPGSTFRAFQESFINYGQNKQPEWLTCLHEEVSVGMCHGYAKVAGKPMAAMVHGTVGTQHASMAIYNAYCDRTPMIIFTGNAGPVEDRRPGVEWNHTAQDGAATIRDFVKWDDQPWSLQGFAESTVRAYSLAVQQPQAPVFIVADGKLQEMELSKEAEGKLSIPKLSVPAGSVGDPNALREAARMLVAADNPVIIADRYARSQKGMDALVALAEALQAPVIDTQTRMNMPTTHYLCQSERAGGLLSQADCILALEPVDLYGQLNKVRDQLERSSDRKVKMTAKVISLSTHDMLVHANYQEFQRYSAADLSILGDAEASVPYLTEAVRREIGAGMASTLEARGRKLRDARKGMMDRARADALTAWNVSPISGARLYAELWNVVKYDDWAFTSDNRYSGGWEHRLWPMEKHYQFIGGAGGAGVGYQPVASLGAALAHRDAGGRLAISVTGDGHFNMAPHTLWTAAHHKIPYLTIIHNNRCYHQEIMHLQRMANRHNRDVENAHIGTSIDDPNIDYANLARSYGAVGIGPILDVADLGPALAKGVAAVKEGAPVLIDVVMQPR